MHAVKASQQVSRRTSHRLLRVNKVTALLSTCMPTTGSRPTLLRSSSRSWPRCMSAVLAWARCFSTASRAERSAVSCEAGTVLPALSTWACRAYGRGSHVSAAELLCIEGTGNLNLLHEQDGECTSWSPLHNRHSHERGAGTAVPTEVETRQCACRAMDDHRCMPVAGSKVGVGAHLQGRQAPCRLCTGSFECFLNPRQCFAAGLHTDHGQYMR